VDTLRAQATLSVKTHTRVTAGAQGSKSSYLAEAVNRPFKYASPVGMTTKSSAMKCKPVAGF